MSTTSRKVIMNPLDNLSSYIRQSTMKREIMDEETARIVVLYVHKFFDDVEADITNSVNLRNQIRNWLVELKHHRSNEPLAVSTKKAIAGIVGRYCRDGGWLLEDDHTKLLNTFRPRIEAWSTKALSDEDTDRLVQYLRKNAATSMTKSRNLLATMVMLSAGLRIGQIVGLKTEDVVATEQTLTVMPTLQKTYRQGKSRKDIPMSVSIGGVALGEAVAWYERNRKESAYYFHNLAGEEMSSAYYRQLFGKIEERLGFTISAHSCRHTAGTRIAQRVSIIAAANILDHTSIRTTQRYVSFENAASESIIANSFVET